jgi:threonylcarbamoyladenosine tRNA methylthiotransferase MtaB
MTVSVYIDTLGCRTNVADSSLLGAGLLAAGYHLAASPDLAQVVIVNSCTVTLGADRDVGKTLRRLRRGRPEALLLVSGCLPRAQATHRVLATADVVVAGNHPDQVLEALEAGLRQRGTSLPVPISNPVSLRAYEASMRLSRANIKIHEGCDCHCSYCIVPTARGGPVSRPVHQVLMDVESALDAGFQELVLTGTHLARYGLERNEENGLADLMSLLEQYGDRCRFRLSSLEPDLRLPAIVQRMAQASCWCPHVHLALQFAGDAVLSAMRRPYRFEQVANQVRQVKTLLPEANVGADFIVGFPTESQADFHEAFANLETLPIDYLHVFSYSARPGTPAASWPVVSTVSEIKARSAQVRALSDERQKRFVRSAHGRWREVLVEHRRRRAGGPLLALTDNYLQVSVAGPDHWMGKKMMVCIEQTPDGALAGRPVDGVE